MILDSHTEGVNQDCDHYASAKVFAVYNFRKGLAHRLPEPQHLVGLLGSAANSSGFTLVAAGSVLGELGACVAVGVRGLII
ncbi:hypothetical protein FKM82_012872 [Ascaphus truei]